MTASPSGRSGRAASSSSIGSQASRLHSSIPTGRCSTARPVGADVHEPRTSTSPFEMALALGLGAVAAVAAWTWTTAFLAGMVFAGERPPLGLAEAAGAAVRLPHHLGDPARAFSPEAESALPGAVAFWFSGAVITVALVASVVGVMKAIAYASATGRARTSAQWARGSDLRHLRVRSAGRGRLALGHAGRHLLAAETGQSVLVVAP